MASLDSGRSGFARTIAGAVAGLLVGASGAVADTVAISQVDTSELLTRQTVQLFVSVADVNGRPVADADASAFAVLESADGINFSPAGSVQVLPVLHANTDGIRFLLLIDNSGSMYEPILAARGTAAADSPTRIAAAHVAVRAFLDRVTDPRDSVGLASFNTTYRMHVPATGTASEARDGLADLQQPAGDQAYTELYAGLRESMQTLIGGGGRRVLIVLSDGENFPYFKLTGRTNPQFGEETVAPEEVVDIADREGISVFAINFGTEQDGPLRSIATATGGAVFDAADAGQLSDVYARIRQRVAAEYALRYRGGMSPTDRRWVRVEYGDEATAATRFYYTSPILGLPASRLSPLLLIPLLLPFLFWLLLTRLRLERLPASSMLSVLSSRGRASTTHVQLGNGKTTIGSSAGASLTIAGVPAVKEQHATVVYDVKAKSHTVVAVGQESVLVNNQPVEGSRTLAAGDVVNVAGTIIVFNDDERPAGAKDKDSP